jgi:hypothetical protein
MSGPNPGPPVWQEHALRADFSERLESSLAAADRTRRHHDLARAARKALPLILLIGPLVGWRLMLVWPGGAHVAINSIAWLAFVLDVGTNVDRVLLAYLDLQLIPSIVGGLLLVLVALWLLSQPEEG